MLTHFVFIGLPLSLMIVVVSHLTQLARDVFLKEKNLSVSDVNKTEVQRIFFLLHPGYCEYK